MTLEEHAQHLAQQKAVHQSRAYELKNMLEVEENTIIAISGAQNAFAEAIRMDKQKADAEKSE